MKKRLILKLGLAVVLVLAFAAISFAAFTTPMRKGDVVDMSVTDAMDKPCWWPFVVIPYVVADYNKHDGWRGPYWTRVHMIDSHAGTHYDSPQHFVPPPGFDNETYVPATKEILAAYEAKYGRRAYTAICNEKVPAAQFVGPLRVVDVTHLVGTIPKSKWPAGPDITVADIKKYESRYGPIKAGDVVAFMCKHSDRYYKPFPEGNKCVYDPLTGKGEGWPTPTPECVFYLDSKG
ncbi:MAG: cyclase family protein, partial [Desulfobacteraceae bacterium]